MNIREIVDKMSIEELCSQVIAHDIQNKDTQTQIGADIETDKPGALYISQMESGSLEDFENKVKQDKEWIKLASKLATTPCLTTTDAEYGPGSYCKPLPEMPNPMAWGALNDEKLVYKAAVLTGRILRKSGINHILAPVVDLNKNFQNALVGIRSISDDPDRVIRLAGAYIDGVQKNGYVGACLKHFPGDGIDDRNQHFMTTINSLSKEEWMATYGKVYKALIDKGVSTIMVAHIGLPVCQEGEIDEFGIPLPATLSKKLITDLLKGELGFKGCVISDAMSMIGACAVVPTDRLGIEYIKAGGDLILFPEEGELSRLIKATKAGEIPLERLKDAAIRVLELKEKLRLFEDQDKIEEEIGDINKDIKELDGIVNKMAEGSIKVVRNSLNVIPVKKEKGKVLLINLTGHYFNLTPNGDEMRIIEEEFRNNGWEVNSLYNPKHRALEKIMNDYDLVVITTLSTFHGATLRVGWNNIMALWRGFILHHPNLIFLSLDDPYKLYDFPYAKTFVNTFGDAECLQRAAVKVILGKVKPTAKNPVSFKGYFERED